jgi:hypothetical protein
MSTNSTYDVHDEGKEEYKEEKVHYIFQYKWKVETIVHGGAFDDDKMTGTTERKGHGLCILDGKTTPKETVYSKIRRELLTYIGDFHSGDLLIFGLHERSDLLMDDQECYDFFYDEFVARQKEVEEDELRHKRYQEQLTKVAKAEKLTKAAKVTKEKKEGGWQIHEKKTSRHVNTLKSADKPDEHATSSTTTPTVPYRVVTCRHWKFKHSF